MRYLPNTAQNQRAMLETIGVRAIEDLLVADPGQGPAGAAAGAAAGPGRVRPRAPHARPGREERRRRRLRVLPGRRRLRPLRAEPDRSHGPARRVPHGVHALPAGGQPGHAADDLRVPDDDRRADRHGRGQRVDLRRRLLAGRGRADGPRDQRPRRRSRWPAASTRSTAAWSRRTWTAPASSCATCPRPRACWTCDAARRVVGARTAALVVQSPNFYGCLEDVAAAAELAHAAGALLVVVSDPVNLGVLEAPGRQGADIVVGEGQGLGVPLGVRRALPRRVRRQERARPPHARAPGRRHRRPRRRRGFVLTLQTREQHIRRAKATSNICTNVALCALMATIYLATLGKQGLVRGGRAVDGQGPLRGRAPGRRARRLAALRPAVLQGVRAQAAEAARPGGREAGQAEHPGRAAAQDARPQARPTACWSR